MNKLIKLLPAFLIVCLCYSSYAKSVDENTAKKVGSNFLISTGIPGVQSEADLMTSYVATAKVGGVTINDFYVFNISGGLGFVMVSGDDLVQPILAYSNDASFNFSAISPEAKFWIEGYQNQITYVVEHNSVATEQKDAAGKWAALKVAPIVKKGAARTTASFPSSTYYLLTTLWDQSPNYNYLCPGSGSTKAYTGCVATAMAQVMKFWNWPSVGTSSHTYTPATNGTLYGAQTADFANTTYTWSSMPNSISTNNPAIGTLMYHAGVSTDMDYGYSAAGSGTYVIYSWSPILNCAQYALSSYFRYKPTLQGLSRSATPAGLPAIAQTTWINYLTTELNAGRPVIYAGSEASGGGHCWVADGYDVSDNMHFNWGWSGTGPNGWYSVNSIAPPSLGAGGGSGNFNTDQCIIIGIEPDSFPSTPAGNIKMLAHLDCPTSSPINYDGSFTVSTKILNSGTTTFSGQFCVQIFDESNNLQGTVQTLTGETITAGDSTAVLTFSTTGMLQLIPGNYVMKAMYRTSTTGAWTAVANNGNFYNFNTLGVANTQTIELYDSIHVGSHTLIRHSPLTFTSSVADLGTTNFSGTIQAVLVNTSTGTIYPVQAYTGQSINANYYHNYTFSLASITAPDGIYVLAIQHQPGSTGSFIYTGSDYYENPILVTIVSPTEVGTVTSNSDNVSVYPNPANDYINIELNGLSVSEIRINDVEGRLVQKMAPAANQQLINVPLSGYAPGMYIVELQSGSEVISRKIVVGK